MPGIFLAWPDRFKLMSIWVVLLSEHCCCSSMSSPQIYDSLPLDAELPPTKSILLAPSLLHTLCRFLHLGGRYELPSDLHRKPFHFLSVHHLLTNIQETVNWYNLVVGDMKCLLSPFSIQLADTFSHMNLPLVFGICAMMINIHVVIVMGNNSFNPLFDVLSCH